MKTNSPSEQDKLKNQSNEQDVNESANTEKNMNQSNSDKNKMPGSSSYKSNKGTGMSSEAGSNQNEESWQGTGGSKPVSMDDKNKNANQSSKGSGNMSNTGVSNRNVSGTTDTGLSGNISEAGNLNTDNIKNQSEQQRRSSEGDGTPEMDEKKLKNSKLGDAELNDVDWDASKNT